MTATAAAETLAAGLERRYEDVLEQGGPEREAYRDDSDQTDVDGRNSTRRLHIVSLSVIAAAQVAWIASLAYGVWVVVV